MSRLSVFLFEQQAELSVEIDVIAREVTEQHVLEHARLAPLVVKHRSEEQAQVVRLLVEYMGEQTLLRLVCVVGAGSRYAPVEHRQHDLRPNLN